MSTEQPIQDQSDLFATRLFQLEGESPAGIEERLATLRELRARSEKGSEDVDQLFAETMARQASEIRGLREVHRQLRELVATLTAPPLYEAVFLEAGDVHGQRLAVVLHQGARRLVSLGQGLDLDSLLPGDLVYLGPEGNVILGRGTRGHGPSGRAATVEGVLADERLLLRDRDAEIVVARAGAFREDPLDVGDRVVFDAQLMMAFQSVPQSSARRWLVQEIEPVSADRIGGFGDDLERTLCRFVEGVHRPDLAAQYGIDGKRSLLLVGPPGCGKTTLMRVIASELGRASGQRCGVAMVNGAELESPWVGETQANIRRLFRELEDFERPKLVFIDEVDAIGRIRGGAVGHHSDKFLSSWLTELEGVRRREDLAVVAATNRKDLIDPALLERLSGLELFVPRPGMDAAREIFGIHLPSALPYSPNGAAAAASREEMIETAVELLYAPNSGNDVAVLRFRDGRQRTVSASELVSGRVIEQTCVAARESAFHRHAEGGEPGVRVEDIQEAIAATIDRLKSVLTPKNVRSYLSDVPQDVDVVAVDPVRRRIRPRRYRVRQTALSTTRGAR